MQIGKKTNLFFILGLFFVFVVVSEKKVIDLVFYEKHAFILMILFKLS